MSEQDKQADVIERAIDAYYGRGGRDPGASQAAAMRDAIRVVLEDMKHTHSGICDCVIGKAGLRAYAASIGIDLEPSPPALTEPLQSEAE